MPNAARRWAELLVFVPCEREPEGSRECCKQGASRSLDDRANGRSSHPIHDPFDTHDFRTSASIDVGDAAVSTGCPGGVDASWRS